LSLLALVMCVVLFSKILAVILVIAAIPDSP
jgi:hypothetical protein